MTTFPRSTSAVLLAAVLGLFCAAFGATPSFKIFMVASKASDHITMSNKAKTLVEQLGATNNFSVDFTTDTSLINDANLAKYQVFLQMHLAPFEMSSKQQAAFQKFIGQGKGWVGVHGAGLTGTQFIGSGTVYWQWYQDFYGGVVYSPHPAYQAGTVIIEDRTHPVTKNLPASFQVSDEWYEWNKSPRPNVRVLGRADESTYHPAKPMGDHPIIWTNEKYPRMIYIGIGHDQSLCSNTNFITLLRDALLWAATPAVSIKQATSSLGGERGCSIRVARHGVTIDLPGERNFSVTVTDVAGRTVAALGGSHGRCALDGSAIGSGIYLLRITSQSGVQSRRVVLR